MLKISAVRLAAATLLLAGAHQASADVIYSNNFENSASAFSGLAASGTLAGLTLYSLPTDSAGLSSANQSMWLGRLGSGLAKSSSVGETVTLSLGGLVANQQYQVSFDLLIGASWDGTASCCGADRWSMSATSNSVKQVLVDATFTDFTGGNMGDGSSKQNYSIATPLAGGAAGTFFAGHDAKASSHPFPNSSNYASDYSIYGFGAGNGGPSLSFTANAASATLTFQRLPTTSGDSADEYWALDNITVTGLAAPVPEPAEWALMLAGIGVLAAAARRFKRTM